MKKEKVDAHATVVSPVSKAMIIKQRQTVPDFPERTADVPKLISSELLKPGRRVAGVLSKERQLSKHGFNG